MRTYDSPGLVPVGNTIELIEGFGEGEEEEEGTLSYMKQKRNRGSSERSQKAERGIRRCRINRERERKGKGKRVKRKGTTGMDGDERDDKAGGRIKLFIWVPPFFFAFLIFYFPISFLFFNYDNNYDNNNDNLLFPPVFFYILISLDVDFLFSFVLSFALCVLDGCSALYKYVLASFTICAEKYKNWKFI